MFEKEIYKLFQVSDVLVNGYGYSQIVVEDGQTGQKAIKDELWFLKFNDVPYQAIRVSYHHASDFFKERNRIESYLKIFSKDKDIEAVSFLDIHINRDAYDSDLEEYDYINIEDGYHEGVDIEGVFPDIINCIHEVDNAKLEINRIIAKASKAKPKNAVITKYPHFFTYLTIGICTLMTILTTILSQSYDEPSVYIAMGADYKTFTLGLCQYFRLITAAFVHAGFLHLICNMISLYSIGKYIERNYGHLKFLIILFYSILIGSLSSEILTDNNLILGISGGIYGLFMFYLMDVLKSRVVNVSYLLITLGINISINFLATTSWQSHIGGLVGGLTMYLLFNEKNKVGPILLSLTLLVCLFYKFVTIDSIDSLFIGTDNIVLNIYREFGFDSLADSLQGRLLEAYAKYMH